MRQMFKQSRKPRAIRAKKFEDFLRSGFSLTMSREEYERVEPVFKAHVVSHRARRVESGVEVMFKFEQSMMRAQSLM